MYHQTYTDRQKVWLVATLFLVSVLSYADRNVLSVLMEGIKQEFVLSDTMIGLLVGFPFALLYAILGLPISRLADRRDRKTILLVCLAIWTIATVLCGFASAVWMLLVARMLVGAGEAGTGPTTHSLVADYCAPTQRSRAYSALIAASAIGGFLALTGGGYLAGRFGWRAAFFGMGALSIPILLLSLVVLDEPRSHATSSTKAPEASPRVGADIRALFAKRSYALLLVGMTTYQLVVSGPLLLAPVYLMRTLHLDVARAGLTFGSALAIGTLIGAIGGGYLGDRLTQRSTLWLARMPAIGMAAALPAGLVAFGAASEHVFFWAMIVMVTTLTACLPVGFAAVQAVCGQSRRALATAILLGSMSLIGVAVGPLLTGVLSDYFAQGSGVESMRSAITIVLWLLVPAAAIILSAGHFIRRDLEA